MFISPAVAEDLTYIGSCSGRFFAFDPEGGVRWFHDTSRDGVSAQFHGEVLLADDLIVVGSDARPAAYLYAFDRRTGEVRWNLPFPGGVPTDLHAFEDTVLALSARGEVVAVDLATGEPRWRREDERQGAPSSRPLNPRLVGGRIFVPRRRGVVDSFDAKTGERLWRRELGARLNTSILPVGGALAVGTVDGRLLRLRPRDGEPLEPIRLGGMLYGELVLAGSCLLALSAEGGADGQGGLAGPHVLTCIDPETSKTRWRFAVDNTWGTFRPLLHGDTVIVGTEGKLFGLAPDGSQRWKRPVDGLPRGLGASPEMLYVGTFDGKVLALPWEDEAPESMSPGEP